MQTIAAVLLGKIISQISRTLKIGGGSAAPGYYGLKIDPEIVSKLSQKIPKNIVITGTNGKTTTARMLAHFAEKEGLKVIRNHTGSNLERGIASTLIQNLRLHLSGAKLNYDLGIWELDEAAFVEVAPKIKPDVIVFLNVFRDQLDRYGEVDSVVKGWSNTLKTLNSQTIILVNGDDANTLKLSKSFKGKVYKFGVQDYKIVGESILHKKEQENLDLEARDVKLNGLNGSIFQLTINDKQSLRSNDLKRLTINLPLPGIYHIYDFLAAFAAGVSLGFKPDKMIVSLKNFSPAFGRVEKLDFGYIFLIKNPAGATQVFETIAPQIKPQDKLLLALNDNLADGTDVSWIWDANFEVLVEPKGKQKSAGVNTNPPQGWKVIVSGTRAYDLANRLKYAGFDPDLIGVDPKLENALREARKGLKGRLFILPTYTAMLELQNILVKSGIKKPYWEEDN